MTDAEHIALSQIVYRTPPDKGGWFVLFNGTQRGRVFGSHGDWWADPSGWLARHTGPFLSRTEATLGLIKVTT